MSHQPERKEKDCLNCGALVQGRYCHVCGQENVVTRQSAWALTKHFVYDVLHFDGSFFETLKYLFTKPGYVARRYAEGKRKSFLDPIRMYLFTSAFFFLIFFSTRTNQLNIGNVPDQLTNSDRVELAEKYAEKLRRRPQDSFYRERIRLALDTVNVPALRLDSILEDNYRVLSFSDRAYVTLEEYDSVQKSLPVAQRDGWLSRKLSVQIIKVNTTYKGRAGISAFFKALLHKLPYLLFASLPFFAIILKLLYIRRKNFYYSDHAVFTLYHYVFTFLLLLLVFAFDALNDWSGWSIFNWLSVALAIYWPIHLFKGMRRFYLQSRGKTAIKFLLLNLLAFFMVILLFILFLFLSIFQV